MAVSEILASIDNEIALLQQARAVLSGNMMAVAKKPGLKKQGAQMKAKAVVSAEAKPAKKKRTITPEGRRRIAEAVKRRWATQKAAASK
jgi:hypothetical protein